MSHFCSWFVVTILLKFVNQNRLIKTIKYSIMHTGQLIRELRLEKGLTQEELAEKTELSTRTIQRIEKGAVDPRAYTLQMIAKALEVEFSLFVDKDEQIKDHLNQTIILGFRHLSSILFIIVPAYLIWLKNRNTVENITAHFKAVATFQFTVWLFVGIGLVQYYFVHMLYALYGAALYTLFFSVMNAVNVFNNKAYHYLHIKAKGKQKAMEVKK